MTPQSCTAFYAPATYLTLLSRISRILPSIVSTSSAKFKSNIVSFTNFAPLNPNNERTSKLWTKLSGWNEFFLKESSPIQLNCTILYSESSVSVNIMANNWADVFLETQIENEICYRYFRWFELNCPMRSINLRPIRRNRRLTFPTFCLLFINRCELFYQINRHFCLPPGVHWFCIVSEMTVGAKTEFHHTSNTRECKRSV